MVAYLIIAVAVIWSVFYTFKKVFPQTAFNTFFKLANFAEAKGQLKLAKWLRPALTMGCGGGCGCSTAPSSNKVKAMPQTVKWK